MSPPELRGRQPSEPAEQPPQRCKSVLFCPACGHESPVGGDWISRDDRRTRTRRVRCPECAALITERPLPRDSLATGRLRTDGGGVAAPGLGRPFMTVAALWRDSVRHWVRWSRGVDA